MNRHGLITHGHLDGDLEGVLELLVVVQQPIDDANRRPCLRAEQLAAQLGRKVDRLGGLAVLAPQHHAIRRKERVALNPAAGHGRLQRRPGLAQEVLVFLIVVHDDDRGEVLDGHAGVAEVAVVLLFDGVAAAPDVDLTQVLQVAIDVAAAVFRGDQGVAVDDRVPFALDRQALAAGQLIAELDLAQVGRLRVGGGLRTLHVHLEAEVVFALGEREGLGEGHAANLGAERHALALLAAHFIDDRFLAVLPWNDLPDDPAEGVEGMVELRVAGRELIEQVRRNVPVVLVGDQRERFVQRQAARGGLLELVEDDAADAAAERVEVGEQMEGRLRVAAAQGNELALRRDGGLRGQDRGPGWSTFFGSSFFLSSRGLTTSSTLFGFGGGKNCWYNNVPRMSRLATRKKIW